MTRKQYREKQERAELITAMLMIYFCIFVCCLVFCGVAGLALFNASLVLAMFTMFYLIVCFLLVLSHSY